MKYLYCILFMLCIVKILRADYQSEEICVINWGSEINHLMVEPEELIYGSADSGEVEYHAGHGPTAGFVDSNENIFIISRYFAQLKCFDRRGNLILDKSNIVPDLGSFKPYDVYVDTLSRFYLSCRPPLNYVPVINLQGNIINKLFPYSDTLKRIHRLHYDISGALFFWSSGDSNYSTYVNGDFKQIDYTWMRANDGFLYASEVCPWENPFAIKVFRYDSPDRIYPPLSEDSIYIELQGDTVRYSELLVGGDGSRLYIEAGYNSESNNYLYEIGLDYNIIDRITIPKASERFLRTMSPFVDQQGHVYEFRFMDDGLHVIKWTKQ